MSDVSRQERRPTAEAVGAGCTALAVLVQGAWLALRYPNAYLDADLLSYLSYYRDWHAGLATRFGYTVPKVLPVVLFGPLGSPEAAAWVTLAVAALGGALVFLLAARIFGVATAWLAALAYVFDPLRSILTLRSSADLYVGVGLLAAMYALTLRAVLWAGLAVLLAALAKPLALVGGVAVLFVPRVSWRRRVAAVAIPLLALPAVSVLDAVLDGRSVLAGLFRPRLPDEHHSFVRVAQGAPLDGLSSLWTVFVDWFGTLLFARTWPLVLIGAGLYVAGGVLAWRRRDGGDELDAASLRGDRLLVVLSVPLVLTAAYVLLAAIDPFVFFTRFFWVLAAAFTILAAYGATSVAAHAPLPTWGRMGLIAVFALALLADRWDDFQWRKQFALDPFETHASLADRGVGALAGDPGCSGAAVVPLAYLPLAAWRLPAKLRRGELCATEDWAAGRGCSQPSCMLVMPAAPTTPEAREASSRVLGAGWSVVVSDAQGALVRSARPAGATDDRATGAEPFLRDRDESSTREGQA